MDELDETQNPFQLTNKLSTGLDGTTVQIIHCTTFTIYHLLCLRRLINKKSMSVDKKPAHLETILSAISEGQVPH